MLEGLPLSLFERIHLIKITSFARLLYPLQTLPLLLRLKDVKALNLGIMKFIWQGKRPRMVLANLWLPKGDVGTELPNVRVYNVAYIMRHALDWLAHSSRFSNWDLEQELVKPWTLPAVLHTMLRNLPDSLRTHIH